MKELRVSGIGFGNGGWVALRQSKRADAPFVLVHVSDDAHRLRVDQLFVHGALSDHVLDGLPLRRVEDLLNLPVYSARIRYRLDLPGPDLATAASYFATSFGGRVDDNGRGAHWVEEMIYAQYPAEMRGRPDGEGALRTLDIHRTLPDWHVQGVIRPVPADLNRTAPSLVNRPVGRPLTVPESRPYPDAFYQAVASNYIAASMRGLPPSKAVKESCTTSVPDTTVYRWVREARERGYLSAAPGKGRAGV